MEIDKVFLIDCSYDFIQKIANKWEIDIDILDGNGSCSSFENRL